MLSCSGTQGGEEVSTEAPIVILASEYSVELGFLGTDCDFGTLPPVTRRGVARIAQEGNVVTWSLTPAADASGLTTAPSWQFAGRICQGDDGKVALRLRGGRLARVAQGLEFCRADLRFPAAPAACQGSSLDICSDPHAVEVVLDPCSGRLFARFRGCLRFAEACAAPSCRVALALSAVPTEGTNTLADAGADCRPPALPALPAGCAQECEVCDCTDG